MVVVDSSVWIEALRAKGRLDVKLGVEGLLEVYEAHVCAPVRLEVLGGARPEDRRALSLYFSVLPYRACQAQDWEDAVALAWKLRSNGLTVPWLDVLIAAIALRDKARVYSVDAHFQHIAALSGLRLYEPAYGGMFKPDGG
jgi:predicted nucleic acid-binding protein